MLLILQLTSALVSRPASIPSDQVLPPPLTGLFLPIDPNPNLQYDQQKVNTLLAPLRRCQQEKPPKLKDLEKGKMAKHIKRRVNNSVRTAPRRSYKPL